MEARVEGGVEMCQGMKSERELGTGEGVAAAGLLGSYWPLFRMRWETMGGLEQSVTWPDLRLMCSIYPSC